MNGGGPQLDRLAVEVSERSARAGLAGERARADRAKAAALDPHGESGADEATQRVRHEVSLSDLIRAGLAA